MNSGNNKSDPIESPERCGTPQDNSAPKSDHPGVAMFMALRGAFKHGYDEWGGGEAWLEAERTRFYASGKDPIEREG